MATKMKSKSKKAPKASKKAPSKARAKAKVIKQRRPEEKFKAVKAKTGGPKPVDKHFVAVKAVDGDIGGGLMEPTDEQMSLINQYTMSEKQPEDVAVLHTLSCNDMYDRDDDGFQRGAIDQFTELEPPYSFVGKSFMLDHEYKTSSATGRIFDEGTETIEGVEFLTHDVYIPRTAQNAEYLENVDFGIFWAVSVGVVMGSTACTVCDSPMVGSYWTFCIENGHEKGLWYDPDSDEKDSWGWAEPVAPGTKGAVKCQQDLFDPVDAYELSQVFLGAQYNAQLAKDPAFKGLVKAAASRPIPILGLSKKDADDLDLEFPHEPAELHKARTKGLMRYNDAGEPTWKDKSGLLWVVQGGELMCLGKSAGDDDDDDEEVNNGSTPDGEVLGADGDEDPGDDDAAEQAGLGVEEGSDDAAAGGSGAGDEGDPALTESESEDDDEDEGGEDEVLDQASVVAAAKAAGLPRDIIREVKANKGGLSALLTACTSHIKGLEGKVKTLTPKAELGDQYLESKRAEAIAWYVKANQEGTKPVKTETFVKMLDRFGDDIDLFDSVIEEQKKAAKSKYPSNVRRSAEHVDVAEVEDDGDNSKGGKKARVIRLHG